MTGAHWVMWWFTGTCDDYQHNDNNNADTDDDDGDEFFA